MVSLKAEENARMAADIASDRLAADILLLDIRGISDFADYFLILTAESARQMDALSRDLEFGLKRAGASLHHREGTPSGGWMLLDFGDILVHVFAPIERDYYDLEGLWSKALQVLRIQ